MGLETGTYVQDLNQSNPIGGTDPKAQGDDHLRLIKSTIKNTLPEGTRALYSPGGKAKTSAYTADATDEQKIISCDATSAAFQVTLPVSSIPTGMPLIVTKTDASAHAVTVAPASGTISGAASFILSDRYSAAMCFWNGTTWFAYYLPSPLGGIAVGGDLDVGGDLNVGGDTSLAALTIGGALTVDGAAEFNDQVQFDAEVKLGSQTLSDGATVNWDMSLGPYVLWTAGGNRTLAAPTGEVVGQVAFLKHVQDATGSRKHTFNAAYKGPGGSVEMPDQAANAETLYLAFVRGSDDVILKRLWGSDLIPILGYKEYDLGALATDQTYTQAHNLARYPALVQVYAECTSADLNYAVGDRVLVYDAGVRDTSNDNNGDGVNVAMNTTNVYVVCAFLNIHNRTTRAWSGITNSKWKFILRVYG